ncbi:Dabb family protein [Kineosporia rhizophila]|uniref:Dabb family protein n=1 Tax=Kineosporia rhizophila TaxID=84633 RepID=UPI000AD40CD2|nr:Dabb family protein [Kineosporia rhizophila]MCE0538673.1 Dabb family protein [Kineosporia rhizophila]
MIFHTIRFSIRLGVTPEQVEEALASLRRQGAGIAAVKSYVVGPHVGEGFDYGATFVIEDLAGYEEYMLSPLHRHTDEIGLPLVDDMVSFDILDDPDPEAGAKITRIHQDRFANDPGLTELIQNLGSYSAGTHSHQG